MPGPDLRLGVDVGGTNTDAVVLDADDRLLAQAKVPTTADVTSGIDAAIAAVVDGVERQRITHAMFGTTHATNAVLERRALRRVGVLRLGGPATHAIRPLFGWPADLRDVVSAGERIVDGGIEFDGRELSPLDEDAIARFAAEVAGRAQAVAIASVFAPVSDRHERRAEEIVRKELGDLPVSCSADIGSVGLLERENATVLNAALVDIAREVAGAIRAALEQHDLRPVTFFAQNDGTLMDLDFAIRFPVLTIGSGPANSIRGAAYLTGRTDAIVVDVGGTSTDVGVLVHGFPRESSFGVEIGGIHTNFRMPDLVTIALGGGTIVHAEGLGPDSVGYRLREEALVFGGRTATLTDAGVAAGRLSLGDGGALDAHRGRLAAAVDTADEMLADAVDRVKTSRDPVPLVAVGGGAPLVPDDLVGVSEVLRPDDSDVANAIGAAIASISGEVDRIFHLGQGGREAAVADASAEAVDRAVSAGAARDGVGIVEVEEVPLAYLTDPAVRIRVKAAGPIAWD
ncbi:MAG TPA: hydantoinase/oxoprolinase family protein [Actinomycetota bacterium]|nr:hydantoinase/oxoprolinase family protein [Actinomycetota bacterium]